MNTEEFMALPPREKDALVGVELFGWHQYPAHVWGELWRDGWPFHRPCGQCYETWTEGEEEPVEACKPYVSPYTTTWNGAGLVIEKMREDGWSFSLDWDYQNPDEWTFWMQADGEPITGCADTPMDAIAIAALKARGALT